LHRAFPYIGTALALLSGCGRFDVNSGSSSAPGVVGSGGVPTGDVDFEGAAAAVGTDGSLVVSWRPALRAVTGYAIFVAADGTALDYGAPLVVAGPAETSRTIVFLPNGVAHQVAVRALFLAPPADENEAVLFGLPNPIRFVDRRSSAGVAAAGLTPETAFPDLPEAFAATGGSANFWVTGGTYEGGLAVPTGSGIYGGFDETFDLDARDPGLLRTTIASPGSLDLFVGGGATIALDGIVLEGASGVGLAVVDSTAFVSNSTVSGFSSDGVHVSGSVGGSLPARASLRRCRIEGNGAEGLDLTGFFEVTVGESIVSGNGNEGIEADDIAPPASESGFVDVVRCVVEGNGDDGIDLDFGPADPFTPGSSNAARPRARISGNRIVGNGERGIILDVDFLPPDGILATALVSGNEIRGNALEGIRLDLDAPALFVLRGNRVTGNHDGGVRVVGDPSDPAATIFFLGDLVAGNDGDGLHFEAVSASVLVASAAVLGNGFAGAAATGAPPVVTSCVLDANGDDLAGVGATFSLVSDGDFGLGNLQGDPLFVEAPVTYDFALGANGTAAVDVGDPASFVQGDRIEIGDDGIPRQVKSVFGSRIKFAPSLAQPAILGAPVWNHLASTSVLEDLALLPGSPAIDAGHPLLPDMDGSPGDLGPSGGPLGAPPGLDPAAAPVPFPFAVRSISPASGSVQTSLGLIAVTFTDDVDPATVGPGTFLVVADSGIVDGGYAVAGSTVLFAPSSAPAPPTTIQVAITGGVQALDGRPLFHPFLARFDLAP